MDIFFTIIVLLGAVGVISVFVFLARAVRKKSKNERKHKYAYELMLILAIIVFLLIGLLLAPIQTVKTAIIVLLFFSVLAVPIHFVFGLQRYLFNRYEKTWHLIAISITQIMCFSVLAYWLFNQFEQGVNEGTIDGPSGLSMGMFISSLTIAMMIIWVINCITAGIVCFRLGNRKKPKKTIRLRKAQAIYRNHVYK